ncbi:hypothetical protein MJO29_000378 [Puccinia striiformis f. sp. tritici]|nr:hypothetical protein MJO29_000378 [Puccinia striiformis f. sp. tritici]
MAPAKPPEDVPSTPPNHQGEPDVPSSTHRESSRIQTPLSRPGFISTASDSRRALIGNPTQPHRRPATTMGSYVFSYLDNLTCHVASKVTQVLKCTGKGIEVDLAQDSDNEHSQLSTKKDKTKDSNGFDHWVLYFHPPSQGPNQKPGNEACACRWCPKEAMVSDQSNYNLKSHQDRENYKSSKKKACAGWVKAIAARSHLPPTPAELIAEKVKTGAAKTGTLVAYTSRGRFDNTTMINVTSKLPLAVWAAGHAHRLYLEQRLQVIKLITELYSKISLILDVWSTKGSHKAFVGITTTNLGSNNFTMARAVAATIKAFDSTTWDVERNHHHCICHVIALILGAGLKALELSAKMVRPEQSDDSFPGSLLATITKVDEPENNNIVEVIAEALEDDDVDPVVAERGLSVPGWEDNNEEEHDGVEVDESGIRFTLKKINYICRQIAGFPQKQAKWKLWAKTLGYKGQGVIGGYGIRWNIAYGSWQHAYEGRRVIKLLLENESEKYVGRLAAKHFFNSYRLLSKEWDNVNSLNQVSKEFLEMTKWLEGDGPKLPRALYEYACLLEELLTALQLDPTPPKCTQSEANASGIDSDSKGDTFNYYPTDGDTVDINAELDQYNRGDFPLDKKGCVLGWWKAHSKDFPVLGLLARDYLACAASLASVEQTFSAAARVCATGRSSLAIRNNQTMY